MTILAKGVSDKLSIITCKIVDLYGKNRVQMQKIKGKDKEKKEELLIRSLVTQHIINNADMCKHINDMDKGAFVDLEYITSNHKESQQNRYQDHADLLKFLYHGRQAILASQGIVEEDDYITTKPRGGFSTHYFNTIEEDGINKQHNIQKARAQHNDYHLVF